MMASKRRQRKDGIHFVNARPTSEMERLDAQRLVRAHVGRWISDQTRDRDRPDPLPLQVHLPHQHQHQHQHSPPIEPVTYSPPLVHPKREPEPDPDYGHGHGHGHGIGRSLPFHSPYDASRPRSASPKPEFLSSSSSSKLGLHSPEDQNQMKWECVPTHSHSRSRSRSPFPPHEDDDEGSDSSGDETISIARQSSPTMTLATSDYTVCPQISTLLDPFNTYPTSFRVSATSVDSCQQYCLNILWPGIVPGVNGNSNALALQPRAPQQWFSLSRSDPTLFAAFMFASLCHQRVMWVNSWQKIQFGPTEDKLLRMCERDSIRLINEAVRDPAKMDRDALLLSIICMAHHRAPDNSITSQLQSTPFEPPLQRLQWLDAYGCLKPNEMHIRGLVELIRMRGGLKNIQLPGLAATISFSEIFAAAVWCIQPIFEFWPIDDRSTGLPIQTLLHFGPEDITKGFGLLQVIGLTPQMAEAFQGARSYISLIQHLKNPPPDSDTTQILRHLNPTTLTDQRNIVTYTLLKLPPATRILSYFIHPNQVTTYEACRLASLILGVGVIFPIPAQNSPLHRLARNIKDVLCRSTAYALWHLRATKAPLIWILVLGGIAATGIPEREFFVLALASVARTIGFDSWLGLKCMLRQMIWHDYAGEKAGSKLWDEARALPKSEDIWDRIVSTKDKFSPSSTPSETIKSEGVGLTP